MEAHKCYYGNEVVTKIAILSLKIQKSVSTLWWF